MLLIVVSLIAFTISTRLWKWYDLMLNHFSLGIRMMDILTWGLVLWYFLAQYKKSILSFPEVYSWQNGIVLGIDNFLLHLPKYLNLHTWIGLTVIGFVAIGMIRLFVKGRLFED